MSGRDPSELRHGVDLSDDMLVLRWKQAFQGTRKFKMAKKHRVALTDEEREELKSLVSRGRAAARKQMRARVLLLCDGNRKDGSQTDEQVVKALDISVSTVERVRQRCVEEGPEAAINRREQANRRPKLLDGAKEAQLVAIACSPPPEGREHWSLRLLKDRMVELNVVESVSRETVRRTLKKTLSSPG